MNELSILGLSQNEEKIYRELLMLKKSTATELAKKSKVPHNRVYDYLEKLIQKGFVRLYPGKIKEFIPASPDELEELIVKKKEELEKTHRIVTELSNIYASNPELPIEFVIGKQNFWKIVRALPQAKTLDYSIKYHVEVHHEAVKKHEHYVTSQSTIDRRVLARIDEDTQKNVNKWKKMGSTILPIENEGIALNIIDDKFMFITMIHSNGTLIVRDKAFIKMMKLLYETYYEKHEKMSK